MNIQVNVINQKLKLVSNIKALVAGTQEFIKFEFIFDDGWDSLKTFVQFKQNGSAYNKYLDNNNSAYLPSEITSGICEILLYGSYGNVIAVTDSLHIAIIDNHIEADPDSTEVSLSLYNQIINMIPAIDATLTISGSAADAATVGTMLNDLSKDVDEKLNGVTEIINNISLGATDDGDGNVTLFILSN